jgi:hypothetical protein
LRRILGAAVVSKNIVSKRRKWALGLVAALLLILLGYVVAGPYLAINGIRNVVAAKEYDQLWRFVDFDRLRDSVRPQLQERIARGIVGRIGPSETARTVGDVTALIAQPAIDAMVSPVGIATLLQGSALAHRMAGDVDADGKARSMDPLKDAKTGYVSPSLFTATVQNAEGQPVVFEFRRDGLSWKLAGLRLPE